MRGDLLLASGSADGNTQPTHEIGAAGWITLDGLQTSGNSACRLFNYYRYAKGGETGNLAIGLGASVNWCTRIIKIDAGTHDPNTPPAFGAAVSGGGADPNPPSLTAPWGSADNLWIACSAGDGNVAYSAAPASFGNADFQLSTDATTANRCALGFAERQNATATEDPGVFTRAAEDSSANTVCVRPFVTAHKQRILSSDSLYQASGTTISIQVEVIADVNRRLFVAVGSEAAGGPTVTGVAFDPAGANTAMTRVTNDGGTTVATRTDGSQSYVSLWELLDGSLPAPGTYTATATYSATTEGNIHYVLVGGTSQAANVLQVVNNGTGAGTATTNTCAHTVSQNDVLMIAFCYKNNHATPMTSLTAAGLAMVGRGSAMQATGGAHFLLGVKGLTTESGTQNIVQTVPGAVRLSMTSIQLAPAIEAYPSGIATAEGFGSATVSQAGGNQDVTASGIASLEGFGTSSLVLQLLANAIATAEAFGTARLDRYITSALSGVVIGSSSADGKNLEFDTPPADPATDKWPAVYAVDLATARPGSTMRFQTRPSLLTYDAMPTGSTPPGGRPSPDTTINVTKALSTNPDFVLVSILSDLAKAITPTGSGGWNFSEAGLVTPGTGFIDAELIPNLQAIYDECVNAGAECWICTYQPRDAGLLDPNNPITAGEITAILYARDRLLSVFGARALNFFAPLKASGDNTIDDGLVLPDGLHPNKAGHLLLAAVVSAANIPAALPLLTVGTGEAFGTQSVQESVAPSGVSSLEAFGTSQLNRTLDSGSAATAEAFGTATTTLFEAPSAIASLEAFGNAALSIANQVAPSGVASLEAFGTSLLNRDLLSGGVGSSETFGGHVVGVPILAAGIASLEAFGAPELDLTLPALGVASGEAFGAALLYLFNGPTGVASLEAFGAPAVWLGIGPSGVASLEGFGAAELQQGEATISPSGIASAGAFGTVSVGGVLPDVRPSFDPAGAWTKVRGPTFTPGYDWTKG